MWGVLCVLRGVCVCVREKGESSRMHGKGENNAVGMAVVVLVVVLLVAANVNVSIFDLLS